MLLPPGKRRDTVLRLLQSDCLRKLMRGRQKFVVFGRRLLETWFDQHYVAVRTR